MSRLGLRKSIRFHSERIFGILCFVVVYCTFISCNESATSIGEKCSSGLVLVLNRSYYELSFPNHESMFFTEINEDGTLENLTMDADEALVTSCIGTGFFISKSGEIATTNHIVAPTEDIDDLERYTMKYVNGIKDYYSDIYHEMGSIKDSISQVMLYKYRMNLEYSNDLSLYNKTESEMNEAAELYNYVSGLNANNAKLIYHCVIGVAYNNTVLRDIADFEPCIVKRTDREQDVAVIQLKSKLTPSDKYIFEIPEKDPLDDYSLADNISGFFGGDKNETVYINGFNQGLDLSLKEDVLHSQLTSGNISQKNDIDVMYTIPTLPGSSGAPVLNRRGELVAINYAGLSKTQSFNYGIRVKYLRYLMR